MSSWKDHADLQDDGNDNGRGTTMSATICQWYALYVRSRHEFSVESELVTKGVEVYLPVVKKSRQWKDRKKLVDFPVFPGYLFVSMPLEAEAVHNVIKTRGVVTLLSARAGEPTPVSHAEIRSLKLLFDSGVEVDICPHLREGARVRVVRGVLQGAEGVIKKKEDHHMLLVNVGLLGRSVGVKIYAEDVEAV